MSIWKTDRQKFGELLLEELRQNCSINKEGRLQYIGGFGLTSFDLLAECLKTPNISGISNKDICIEQIIKDVIEHLLTENISINEQNFCLKFNHFLKRK
ncbi:TPA: hypothetical protein P5R14_003033, partial [Legionella pneumophila]|nr:hypothetical protein [Legionella pneumophila]